MSERSFDRTRLGVKETGDYGASVLYPHILLSPHVATLRQREVNVLGRLPRTGAAILVPNHESAFDNQVLLWFLPHTLGRLPVTVVKESLLRKGVVEDEKIEARTGKKNDVLHKDGWPQDLARMIVSRGDCLGLKRGDEESLALLNVQIAEKISQQRLLILFGQETRLPKRDLREYGIGAAKVASDHPDTPVYNVGISGSGIDFTHGIKSFWETLRGPVILNISAPTTYNVSGAKNVMEFARILQAREAVLLPDHLKKEYMAYQNR